MSIYHIIVHDTMISSASGKIGDPKLRRVGCMGEAASAPGEPSVWYKIVDRILQYHILHYTIYIIYMMI